MRLGALTGARAVLLAGPMALAFFSGGYFDEARAWAGLLTWGLLALALLVAPRPVALGAPAWLALGSLALLGAWTLASFTWAPLAGPAYHDGQRVLLYAGALAAATLLLRDRRATRAAEAAVAAGALIVASYGMSERLLPGLLSFHRFVSAQGRLEQPLTYWNSMGLLAALGLVLCARIAGDASRPIAARAGAAAAGAPLGMGLYCTFSRGALFACAAGLVALLVAAPSRDQLLAGALVLAAAVAGALAAAPFHGVTALAGSPGAREAQGAVALALLVAIAAAVAYGARAIALGRVGGGRHERPLRLPRHAPALALLVVLAGFALFLAVGAKERNGQPLSGGAARLGTLQSNRYAYWRVAWRAFKAEPLHGVGGGGWAIYWLRYRPFAEGARDAHSLPIQTAAELGVVGVALLGAFAGGVVWAARRAHAHAPTLTAGAIAAVATWAAHAAIDWDWEMPAATLPALVLAGALLGLSARPGPDRAA